MEQSTLFEHMPGPARADARHTDPDTSAEAASDVRSRSDAARRTQRNILHILAWYGPATDEQIADKAQELGVFTTPSGMRTRRKELVDQGLVVVLDEDRTRAGRRTIVWALAEGVSV